MIINATPQKGIVRLNLAQRMLGLAVELNVQSIGRAGDDLCADAFWSYFLKAPEMLTRDETPIERDLNWILLDWVTSSPNWENSKLGTQGRIGLSVISAQILWQFLMSDEAIRAALASQEHAEQMMGDSTSSTDGDEKGDGESQNVANSNSRSDKNSGAVQKAMAQSAKELQDKLQGIGARTTRTRAIERATKTVDEVSELCRGFGVDASNMSAEDVKPILEAMRILGDTSELISLMGRSKGVAMASYKKRHDHILSGIGYTQNPQNILASELAALSGSVSPYLRATKAAEFSERGLLGFVCEREGERHGGVIIGIDDSGSMRGDLSLRAKSLAMGLCQAAYANRQSWKAFMFAADDDPILEVDSESQFSDLLDFIGSTYGGGTSFEKAIDYAVDTLAELGDKAHEWDIVILTDGESRVPKETISKYKKLKELYGCRLIWLSISSYESGYWEAIKEFSTAVVLADATIEPEDIAKKLSEIICEIT